MHKPAGRLWLGDIQYSRQQVSMTYGLDDLRFETAYWYSDVDLHALARRYTQPALDRILFHMLAFEANKLLSLAPATLDLGRFAHHHTEAFEHLWRTIAHKVWAQWRYENNWPDYAGPTFLSRPQSPIPQPVIENELGDTEVLCFCGGGKDSLVALKLLERAEIPFATYVYAHTLYGPAAAQHDLVDRLLRHTTPVQRHRHWVYDSLVDAPLPALYPEYGHGTLLAAETPSSLFGVLPVMLQHGYRYAALAHERSANVGNLIWDLTGEDVNHQWGKSREAEQLLAQYVQTQLVANIDYFSLLQPLYDVAIFNLLKQDLAAVPDTHSCNIRKPWCGRCPKCAYVWINYMAYLPEGLVDDLFRENLLDVEDNQLWFRQMLGLEAHTPFECIGQIPEARLAFERCRRKGLTGKAMHTFVREVPPVDVAQTTAAYLKMDFDGARVPAHLARRVYPLMREAVRLAQED